MPTFTYFNSSTPIILPTFIRKYKAIAYKGGKWFILQDEAYNDIWDIEIGEMDDEDITDEFLKEHVDNCIHYGIPPVLTSNQELNDRVDKLLEEYDAK